MRRRFWSTCVVLGLLVIPIAAYSKDTSLRCGTSFVSPGDSQSKILYHCGEPYLRQLIGYSKLPDSDNEIEFFVENWTYDFNQSHFYIITFFGGRVETIESEKKW